MFLFSNSVNAKRLNSNEESTSYWMSVAIFVSQFLLQIIPYKLTLHFITHKCTRQTDTFIRYSAEQKATKNGIFIQKKTSAQKRKKKSNAIWTKIGNILKPNTCYILKSVNSMKLIQIKWTQLVILKGEILFKYLSNQYIFIVWRRRGWLSHLDIGTGETERITKYYES